MIKLVIPELGVIYQEINEDMGIWLVIASFPMELDELGKEDRATFIANNGEKWPVEIRLIIAQGPTEEAVLAATHFEKEPLSVDATRLSSLLSQAAMMFKIDNLNIDEKLDAK